MSQGCYYLRRPRHRKYLLGSVQSEGETARAASKESRHPLRKFSQLCTEIAVRREMWSYSFCTTMRNVMKTTSKFSQNLPSPNVSLYIREIMKISLKFILNAINIKVCILYTEKYYNERCWLFLKQKLISSSREIRIFKTKIWQYWMAVCILNRKWHYQKITLRDSIHRVIRQTFQPPSSSNVHAFVSSSCRRPWKRESSTRKTAVNLSQSGARFFRIDERDNPETGMATEAEVNKLHRSRFAILPILPFSRGTEHFTPFSMQPLDVAFCATIHLCMQPGRRMIRARVLVCHMQSYGLICIDSYESSYSAQMTKNTR